MSSSRLGHRTWFLFRQETYLNQNRVCGKWVTKIRITVEFMRYIGDNAWVRIDMEFLFECWTRYLTSEPSERVKYRVEHEKRNSISTSSHVTFYLLYNHNNDDFFDDFPNISEHLSKISEDSPKVIRRSDKLFRTFSEHYWRFSKITEDFRGRRDDVSIIEQHI